MVRKVIHIEEEKCNGCGLCAAACHEGAIGMVGGKAKLLREDYCDGLGDCLPTCPTGAITFVEREADAYDEAAVLKNKRQESFCPGMQSRSFQREEEPKTAVLEKQAPSQLRQWPVQIKLVPVHAPYFQEAKLLLAADCTAYAYASFHEQFMRDRITLVGCPKLDQVDYAVKLADILRENDIKSMTIVRMEVPCCGGLEQAAKQALKSSGKLIPWQVVTISTDGNVLDES